MLVDSIVKAVMEADGVDPCKLEAELHQTAALLRAIRHTPKSPQERVSPSTAKQSCVLFSTTISIRLIASSGSSSSSSSGVGGLLSRTGAELAARRFLAIRLLLCRTRQALAFFMVST
jgi:hypothetical protein